MDKYALAKTPMMKQWRDIKHTLSDEIVFCRVGDFYELFYDDAEIASKALDLQLTKRKLGDGDYPMAGVPYRSIDTYIAKLVNQGFKVAIIDQLEDAKATRGKKAIARGLTRIITKGTLTDETMLSPGKNNYLASLIIKHDRKSKIYGFSVCDLSTGDFRAGEFTSSTYSDFLRSFTKYEPVEILYPEDIGDFGKSFGLNVEFDEILTPKTDLWFDIDSNLQLIYEQFNVTTTKGFGFADNSVVTAVVGGILRYLKETQFTNLPHLKTIKAFDISETMLLDSIAIRGLELFENNQDHSSFGSLFAILNETVTPMGTRMLRHWIANPLAKRDLIDERLRAVSKFKEHPILLHQIRDALEGMGDIERLITRISMGNARPDQLVKLANSLETIPDLRNLLVSLKKYLPRNFLEELDPCEDIVSIIRKSINEEPIGSVGEGNIVKKGYNSELDKLLGIKYEGNSWLNRFSKKEMNRTGISSLKIKQNNVFGYFIEISKKEIEKVPDDYVKKQSMVNVSRYVCEELKNWETDVIEAEIRISEIESRLYSSILKELSQFVGILQQTASALAQLDCLTNFSFLAERREYVKPDFESGRTLIIKAGRHPVIEELNQTISYVPNDVELDYEKQRLMIITGPNFSGKSSLLRAVALITIMAHIGSYVPAKQIKLGIVDRIFTRIGASDNLVAGQSTFMMEMIDAANLVNNATDRSLVIADELGRGTSTYDGLAIAWAIAEYLHNSSNSPKTMIATHYHQLAELEGFLETCVNYQFSIRFENDKPIFDHKLVRGSSDKSFGVEVAKLSGLPNEVINRAKKILDILESKSSKIDPQNEGGTRLVDLIIQEDGQLSLLNWFDEVTGLRSEKDRKPSKSIIQPLSKKDKLKLEKFSQFQAKLQSLNLDNLSPIEALNLLAELQKASNFE